MQSTASDDATTSRQTPLHLPSRAQAALPVLRCHCPACPSPVEAQSSLPAASTQGRLRPLPLLLPHSQLASNRYTASISPTSATRGAGVPSSSSSAAASRSLSPRTSFVYTRSGCSSLPCSPSRAASELPWQPLPHPSQGQSRSSVARIKVYSQEPRCRCHVAPSDPGKDTMAICTFPGAAGSSWQRREHWRSSWRPPSRMAPSSLPPSPGPLFKTHTRRPWHTLPCPSCPSRLDQINPDHTMAHLGYSRSPSWDPSSFAIVSPIVMLQAKVEDPTLPAASTPAATLQQSYYDDSSLPQPGSSFVESHLWPLNLSQQRIEIDSPVEISSPEPVAKAESVAPPTVREVSGWLAPVDMNPSTALRSSNETMDRDLAWSPSWTPLLATKADSLPPSPIPSLPATSPQHQNLTKVTIAEPPAKTSRRPPPLLSKPSSPIKEGIDCTYAGPAGASILSPKPPARSSSLNKHRTRSRRASRYENTRPPDEADAADVHFKNGRCVPPPDKLQGSTGDGNGEVASAEDTFPHPSSLKISMGEIRLKSGQTATIPNPPPIPPDDQSTPPFRSSDSRRPKKRCDSSSLASSSGHLIRQLLLLTLLGIALLLYPSLFYIFVAPCIWHRHPHLAAHVLVYISGIPLLVGWLCVGFGIWIRFGGASDILGEDVEELKGNREGDLENQLKRPVGIAPEGKQSIERISSFANSKETLKKSSSFIVPILHEKQDIKTKDIGDSLEMRRERPSKVGKASLEAHTVTTMAQGNKPQDGQKEEDGEDPAILALETDATRRLRALERLRERFNRALAESEASDGLESPPERFPNSSNAMVHGFENGFEGVPWPAPVAVYVGARLSTSSLVHDRQTPLRLNHRSATAPVSPSAVARERSTLEPSINQVTPTTVAAASSPRSDRHEEEGARPLSRRAARYENATFPPRTIWQGRSPLPLSSPVLVDHPVAPREAPARPFLPSQSPVEADKRLPPLKRSTTTTTSTSTSRGRYPKLRKILLVCILLSIALEFLYLGGFSLVVIIELANESPPRQMMKLQETKKSSSRSSPTSWVSSSLQSSDVKNVDVTPSDPSISTPILDPTPITEVSSPSSSSLSSYSTTKTTTTTTTTTASKKRIGLKAAIRSAPIATTLVLFTFAAFFFASAFGLAYLFLRSSLFEVR